MKFIIAFFTVVFCTGCIHVPVTPAVEGVVRDADSNEVVAGVKLTLSNLQRSDWRSEAISGKDGAFQFSPIKIWTPVPFAAVRLAATIEAQKEGYEASAPQSADKSPVVVILKRRPNKAAEPTAMTHPPSATTPAPLAHL